MMSQEFFPQGRCRIIMFIDPRNISLSVISILFLPCKILMIPDHTPSIRSITDELYHLERSWSLINKITHEIKIICILKIDHATKGHEFIITTMYITDKESSFCHSNIWLDSLPFQYPLVPRCNPHFHEVSDFYAICFRDEYFLKIPSSSHPGLIFSLSGYQDIICPADHEHISSSYRFTEDIIEDIPAASLFSWRDIILEPMSRCRTRTSRVASDERDIELTLSHRGGSSLELFLSLSWEPDDDVCRDTKKRVSRAEIVYLRFEVGIGMFAIHPSEHRVTPGLECEVQVRSHMW
jgi:hypothetical protein